MTDIRLRPAGADDLPAIVTLLFDDDLGASREQAGGEVAKPYRRAFEQIQASPDNVQYVADLNGRVVGCFQVTFTPSLSFRGGERVTIESVRVAKSLRGSGVGSQMMQEAIRIARERGARLVQLSTNREREAAHRFYERLGFVASHIGMKLDLGA